MQEIKCKQLLVSRMMQKASEMSFLFPKYTTLRKKGGGSKPIFKKCKHIPWLLNEQHAEVWCQFKCTEHQKKCPQLRLQTCTAHFHSTQLDCLSHLTWLVKSYPSLLMGNMEGQKTKYNGPTHPNFFPSEQQILNSKMTRQSRLKRVPKTEAVQSC